MIFDFSLYFLFDIGDTIPQISNLFLASGMCLTGTGKFHQSSCSSAALAFVRRHTEFCGRAWHWQPTSDVLLASAKSVMVLSKKREEGCH